MLKVVSELFSIQPDNRLDALRSVVKWMMKKLIVRSEFLYLPRRLCNVLIVMPSLATMPTQAVARPRALAGSMSQSHKSGPLNNGWYELARKFTLACETC